MTQTSQIRTVEQLYAHAIAIEREAAERYAELGERMSDLGNDLVGELFLRLAQMEKEHERLLERRAEGLKLPGIERTEYAWLGGAGPETAAHDLVFSVLTPHSALELALGAEERAAQFFESARLQIADPSVASLAAEMAVEEGVHIAWVKSALRRTPNPVIDWNAVFS